MDSDEFGGFLDREQLLGGSPARRAATLLFLIETRAVRLAAQARRQLLRPLTEASAQERALEFVEAFSAAREEAVQPSVDDLERQAERWAPMIPDNPRLQAALARRFGEKYRFTARVAPGIRRALGLDDPAVAEAYRSLYDEPVESVYAARLTRRERLHWAWTRTARRLERMPPFWTAYSLTLTETVGADILALPIVVASLGALPAVGILVVIGILNVVTAAQMAESVVRTGPMRYANAYLGRLYESNLGARGAVPATVLLVGSSFVWIPVCYVGIGRTLAAVTSVPAAVWVALFFAATIALLRKGSLDATLATVVVIGAVDLVLLLGISALGLAHVHQANLLHTHVPFVHGHPFDASAVALVFGVVLMAYFGHLSAATCGSLVLERDPGGRSLVLGCAAAQGTAIALYSLFVVAINGALAAAKLTGSDGTVVSPLAHVAGPAVAILGSVFVILALGLASVMEGLSLSWLVQERLPAGTPRIVALPRRRARVVFRGGRGLRVGLAYLGASRFAVDVERPGGVEQSELAVTGRADVFQEGRHRVTLEVLEADGRRARIAVTSTLRVGYEGELADAGLDLAELLALPDEEAALAAALARTGEASPAEVAAATGAAEQDAAAMLAGLAARGLVAERQTGAGPVYSARMAPRRARSSPVWDALTDDSPAGPAAAGPSEDRGERIRVLLSSRAGRLVVSILPLGIAFALAEWFVIAGVGSFAGLLGFLGIIVVSLLAGLYPLLLLLASRRKGEYAPGGRRGVPGHPVLLGAVYLFFLAVLVVHGAVIWSAPASRAAAFAAALAMVAIPVALARGGAFTERLTVEVRDDQRLGTAHVALLSADRPHDGEVTLEYAGERRRDAGESGEIADFDSLRRAVATLRRSPGELKVWAHRVTPEGESEPLPATAVVRALGEARTADLALSGGEALFPLAGPDAAVEITLRTDRA